MHNSMRVQNPYKQLPSQHKPARKPFRPSGASSDEAAANAHPNSKKKATTAPPAEERWVVVIKNVEADMAKIHEHAVERFCSLNPTRRRTSALVARNNNDNKKADDDGEGEAEQEKDQEAPEKDDAGIRYEIVSRSETRSVEVVITRPSTADGEATCDISSVFLPLAQSFAGTGHNVRHTKLPKKQQKEDGEDEGEEGHNNNVEERVEESSAANHSAPRYTSIDDMVAALCHKAYFTHPPTFVVGEGLATTQSNSEAVGKRSVKKSAASNRKRERDTDEDRDEQQPEEENQTADGAPKNVIRGGRQKELATASASLSSPLPAKAVKKLLADIPGFLSVWNCGGRQVRLVFKTVKELWKAKALLDQFEADGVRVRIVLPDSMMQAYNSFTAAEEEQL